ncbi:MAG: lipocalin-like domain-containing protein [Vicinamibacterales bacterium]
MTGDRSDEAPLSKRIVGSWELTFREDRDAQGLVHPDPGLGPDPVGLLVYDAGGRFSAQFMMRDRSAVTDRDVASVSGRNNTRAVNGYDAYFGRYTVDDVTGTVTQILEGALASDNVGVVVTRRMTVTGDGLELRLPTTALDGTPVIRTLRWRRVA